MKDSYIINIFSTNPGEIYWSDIDFDKGKYYLTLKGKKERQKRITLFMNIFFKYLEDLNKSIYVIPCLDIEDNYYCWFHYWNNISKNFYYREIIAEANKNNIYLKQTKVIDYNYHKDLAIKFFKGNVNYISKACYIIPELNIAYQPTHNVELLVYGDSKSHQYVSSIKDILSYDTRLRFSL